MINEKRHSLKSGPDTRDPGPETWDPETRDPGPRDSRPGTVTWDPEIWDPERTMLWELRQSL